MSLSNTLYNTFFKKTSTFYLTSVALAFFFERSLDLGSDVLFESVNKGKLWKDIKHNYEQ